MFDEYCTENKKIGPFGITKQINLIRRSILDDKKIEKFFSDVCGGTEQWKETKKIEERKKYEQENGYLPGDFLLYEIENFDKKTISIDGDFLYINFTLKDVGEKYIKYIKYVSETIKNEDPFKFYSTEINFIINIKNYQINKINIFDKYYSGKKIITEVGAEISNKIEVDFFYDTEIKINKTSKIDYSIVNCSNCSSDFKFNLTF